MAGTGGQILASIHEHIRGVEFPASKQDLVRAAQHQSAPAEVVDEIRRLPRGRFESPTAVTEAYGRAH